VQKAVKLSDDSGNVICDIPSGTTMKDDKGGILKAISAANLASPPAPPAQNAIILAKEMGPSGATFDPPITITMKFDPASLPAGLTKDKLVMAFWDGAKWVNLVSTVDSTANTVSAKVSHFTPYAILGATAPPAQATPTTPAVTTPATTTPAVKPTLRISAPAAGAVLPAGNVTVTAATENITLVPPTTNVAGQGHLHYYLDVAIPTTPGAPAVTAPGTYQATPNTSAVWANLTAGTHTLGVQLVNNDHTPMVPPITATVTITVSAPPTTPAVTTPAVTSPAVTTPASQPTTTVPPTSGGVSLGLIIGIVAAVVVVIVLVVVFTRKKSAK
jgi:hypothetical protein